MLQFFFSVLMTYSNHLVNLVLHNIKDGKSIVQVSQIYNVAKQTIYRWIKMYMDQVIMNQMVTWREALQNEEFVLKCLWHLKHVDPIVNWINTQVLLLIM